MPQVRQETRQDERGERAVKCRNSCRGGSGEIDDTQIFSGMYEGDFNYPELRAIQKPQVRRPFPISLPQSLRLFKATDGFKATAGQHVGDQ